MWKVDATVNKTEPAQEMLRIPQLHAKYIAQITSHSVALKMKRIEMVKLKKQKLDYYSGRMSQDELKKLGLEPFQFILKTDIGVYVESDKDIVELTSKMINNEEAVTFCTAVCKELNNRTWQIKEFMGWERFIVGQ